MKIIELKNVIRKDSLIHYINKYDCVVVYKTGSKKAEQRIKIILEKTAFGTTNIGFDGLDENLETNRKILEAYIDEQNRQGLFD